MNTISFGHLWRRDGLREGLDWRWQWLVFFLVALLVVSRRPDVLTNPQFYAEDGAIWYAQTYNMGWLHPLVLREGGYLNTLPRLAADLSLLVSLRWAPLVMNLAGIALQALPVTVLLSSRGASWGSLRLRAMMAVIYIALPNSQEVDVVITNAQWHLALAACLLAFGSPPRNRGWRAFDIAMFLICGLTGPFCLVLLPLALVYWWRRRESWTLAQAGVLAFCAAVQAWELASSHAAMRAFGPLGASPSLLVRLIAGQVYIGALRGTNQLTLHGGAALITGAFVCGTVALAYALVKANLPLKLFVAFAVILLAASLKSPLITGPAPRWQLLAIDPGGRYWFFPMLALLWSLLWFAARGPSRAVRIVGVLALLAMLRGVWHDWEYPAFRDEHFARYVVVFQQARPGAQVAIPIDPDGWHVRLTKR